MSECHSLYNIGVAYPVSKAGELRVKCFGLDVPAGFPVPLDNDEKAESIELLRMLCPYPESSYLIRVDGNSLVDAGIYSGDIVIVDKSRRNPSAEEIAVCVLNGEYTMKRFVKRNGVGCLVPVNPDYQETVLTEEDSFYVWGTVTYVIHKPIVP